MQQPQDWDWRTLNDFQSDCWPQGCVNPFAGQPLRAVLCLRGPGAALQWAVFTRENTVTWCDRSCRGRNNPGWAPHRAGYWKHFPVELTSC